MNMVRKAKNFPSTCFWADQHYNVKTKNMFALLALMQNDQTLIQYHNYVLFKAAARNICRIL
tara:strand:+ start:161 stop:346 length:186 start_codon:yes stop_codon:yes gene_type:complete